MTVPPAKPPCSVATLTFWRAYWVTLRPYLAFVSGVSGLVGLTIAPPSLARLALSFGAFFVSYGLGQALTDVSQIDTDTLSSPYRPLTRGVIAARDVAVVSVTGLAVCAAIWFCLNPWTLVFCVAGVVGLATYTPFKRRWWGGPPWNSWVVALLPIVGRLSAERSPGIALAEPRLWALVASVFSSYAIFVLLGYFKDMSADRATGYETLPVKIGWKPAVLVSCLLLATTATASATAMLLAGAGARAANSATVVAAVEWLAGLTLLALAHLKMWRTGKETEAHLAIAHVVRGYVLIHLGEAVASMPALAAPSLASYGLFELALAFRPEKAQI